jgi:uncharacterized protein (TIRG00374 family)
VRIRYFGWLGVPAEQVVACFVFERIIDLLVVLMFASLIVGAWSSFWPALAFAVLLMAAAFAVILFLHRSTWWREAALRLRRRRWRGAARAVQVIGQGISSTLRFFNSTDIMVSVAFGLGSWGLYSLGFVYLISGLGLAVPTHVSIAIYPLATLIGNASMFMAGIGTTEAAITLLLQQFGAPLGIAAVAAIAMRLSTLWFSIVLGLASAALLEIRHALPVKPTGLRRSVG